MMNYEFTNTVSLTKNNNVEVIILNSKEYYNNVYDNNACKSTNPNYASLKYLCNNFSGKKHEKFTFINPLVQSVLTLYGLGEQAKLTPQEMEKIGFNLYTYLKGQNFQKVLIVFNAKINDKGQIDYEDNSELMLSLANGMQLSDYQFNKYKTNQEEQKQKTVYFATKSKNMAKKFDELKTIKDNVFLARDLGNEPANVLNPETYSEFCKTLTSTGLEVEVLEEEQIKELGMNAVIAVGQGSIVRPRFVIMKWQGLDKFENPVALVGKGVTFDSGGLSLKPSESMRDMKDDMSGSAVLVATMKTLAENKVKANVVAVFALVENMPSGSAVKIGDVVKSMSGQTIEILNTDAEGRLILADSLYYAVKTFKPTTLIDIATLTGAISIALGEHYAGVFTRNDNLFKEVEKVSKKVNEPIWRMPLEEVGSSLDSVMNSKIADVKNISENKFSGASNAAQFLQRFTDKHPNWVHIDIACVASTVTKPIFFTETGNTGFGVRLLYQLIIDNYAK